MPTLGDEGDPVPCDAVSFQLVDLAPREGHSAARRTVQAGQRVAPGALMMAVVPLDSVWVDANFKETELKEIRPGQSVSIKSDIYPDHPFHGTVVSLSGGSGTAFSLLPAQNATGNWVKVTQRVPVRIKVDDPDPAHPLRIGTTASVKVKKSS